MRAMTGVTGAIGLATALACGGGSGGAGSALVPSAPRPARADGVVYADACAAAEKACLDAGVTGPACESTCCYAQLAVDGYPALPDTSTAGFHDGDMGPALDPALCALDQPLPEGTTDLLGRPVVPLAPIAGLDGVVVAGAVLAHGADRAAPFVIHPGMDGTATQAAWMLAMANAGYTAAPPEDEFQPPEGTHLLYVKDSARVHLFVDGGCGDARYPTVKLSCVTLRL